MCATGSAIVFLRALRQPVAALTFLALPLAATAQEASIQDLGDALAAPPPPAVIYTAKEIVTLDPARPSVAAVAVAGDRILATGSLDQVRTALRIGCCPRERPGLPATEPSISTA